MRLGPLWTNSIGGVAHPTFPLVTLVFECILSFGGDCSACKSKKIGIKTYFQFYVALINFKCYTITKKIAIAFILISISSPFDTPPNKFINI